MQVYKYGSYADPAEGLDILTDVAKGHVKAAMLAAFKASSEKHMILRRKPDLTVVATKEFAQAGDLVLVGFSNTLQVAKCDGKRPVNVQPVDGALKFEHKGCGYNVFMKHGLHFPKQVTVEDTIVAASQSCIVCYWGVRATEDRSKVNMERATTDICIKIGDQEVNVKVPIVRNTRAIEENDELFLSNQSGEEPPAKKTKTEARQEAKEGKAPAPKPEAATSNAVSKGKTKGKAKGKGKGKLASARAK